MTYNTDRPTTWHGSQLPAEQARGTLEQARDRAGQAADDVRDAAQQTLDKVSQNFDLGEQVDQRPWLMFGVAAAAGYLLGNLGAGQSQPQRRQYQPGRPAAFPQGPLSAAAMQQARTYESTQREGMVGKLGRKFFSNLGTLEDLFHEQLQDLYDAEHQILKALPSMIEAASSPELKRGFAAHLQQTRGHVQRLDQVFGQLGARPQGKACAAMQGLLAEGQELMAMRADPVVMDAGLIAAAQRVEHYEMAGYGCLRTWARQLGYSQAAQLLQQTLDEEEQTDKQLSQIAERGINVRAAGS